MSPLREDVHNCTIHYNIKLQTNYMFINRRMDKSAMVYSCNEIPPSNENEYTIATFNNMGESHELRLKRRKQTQKETCCIMQFI